MAPKKKPPEYRVDDFENAWTRVGGHLDKRRASRWAVSSEATSRIAQEVTWRSSDMFARAVELLPETAMREGFTVKVDDSSDQGQRGDAFPPAGLPTTPKPPPVVEPDDAGQEMSDGVLAYYEDLDGDEKLTHAWFYGRAYGGGGLLLGADDGNSDVSLPLDEENIRSIDWLTPLTNWELRAFTYYGDPTDPKYGEPQLYVVNPEALVGASPSDLIASLPLMRGKFVHESRVIPFPGRVVSQRHRVESAGWGDSILVSLLEHVRDFESAFAGTSVLLSDFAQAIMKVKGLAQAIQNGREDAVVKRAQLIERTRSSARAVLVDADGEDFERKQTPVSGLPELLDRFMQRLAAAMDVPVSLLMGMAPAGLNATGDADVRWFYDRVKMRQAKYLRRRLTRLLRLIFLAKDGPTAGREPGNWCVEFKPLWQPTLKEQAETRETMARADVAYVNAGIVTAAEVAASRFGGRDYSLDTRIDVSGRAQLAADYEAESAQRAKAQAAAAAAAQPQVPPGEQPQGS